VRVAIARQGGGGALGLLLAPAIRALLDGAVEAIGIRRFRGRRAATPGLLLEQLGCDVMRN
jgi:hypothetical protein